ncbi:MAG: prepilin-type N-terminal cleavage/methylation domain-containing protein [Gammaproteobacteria bacterium]|nr:prepilin-type N-terminal cleavage/methylation domain-containing protein [Gammaproteobacteria bacterium]
MTKNKGFTLIELILVIVILVIIAITAAPKFIDLGKEAQKAAFTAIAAAFRAGVERVHFTWLIRGNGLEIQNFITIWTR